MALLFAFLLLFLPGAHAQVDVHITADNAYGFGWGNGTATANWFGGVENGTAGDIFSCATGPETYNLPAGVLAVGDYLYIAAWHDRAVWEGVLADVAAVGFPPVLSGVGPWEVCPSGQYFAVGSGGPSQAQVDQIIQRCNSGTAIGSTTAQRWLDAVGDVNGKLAVGEDNLASASVEYGTNQYPQVCNIDPGARWMWMDWAPSWFGPGVSPFVWSSSPANTPEPSFYLFRLPADAVPGATEDCLTTDKLEIECQGEGVYDVSFAVTNLSGVDVDAIDIPHAQVSPNVVPVNLPDQGSATVDLTVTGAPGDEVCFELILDPAKAWENGEEPCCVETVCVTLPDCACFELEPKVACLPGEAAGTFQVWTDLANHSGTVLEDVFVEATTTPGTITPGWIDLPGLADGATTNVGPFTVVGADPTQPFCFEVAAHDRTRETCCEETVCVDVPPACDDGGGHGGANSSANGTAATPFASGCDQRGVGGSAILAGLGVVALGLRRRRG